MLPLASPLPPLLWLSALVLVLGSSASGCGCGWVWALAPVPRSPASSGSSMICRDATDCCPCDPCGSRSSGPNDCRSGVGSDAFFPSTLRGGEVLFGLTGESAGGGRDMALDRAEVLVDDEAGRVGRIGARGDTGEEAAVDVDRRERLETDGLMVDKGWLSLRLGKEGLCGRAAAALVY